MYDMIKNDFYLSNVGAAFDGANDCGRDEVEHNLKARFQGIMPGFDYIIQPRLDCWQVNGMSPLGAKAVASISMGMHFQPNRIDVTFEQLASIEDFSSVLDFDTLCQFLIMWFKRHKPKTQIEFTTTAAETGRLTIGARTARYSIVVEQVTEKFLAGVRVTFKNRQDNVLPVWLFIQQARDLEQYADGCKAAFAACTASFIEPDFFGVGLDKDLFLMKEKDVTKSDYWGFLAGVASKIVNEAKKTGSMKLTEESVSFLQNEIAKSVIRVAREESEKRDTIDRMAEVGYN
jgi:hypothetical protein